MELTKEQLVSIMPYSKGRVDKYLSHLNKFMREYGINTPHRIVFFLATIAIESGELRYTKELASGAAYDTGRLAKALGNTPEKDGDGQRFKGRGLIQLTGTNNYKAYRKATGIDVITQPELLEKPEEAVRSACWFWQTKGLNEIADKNDAKSVRKRVNGGYNGFDQFLVYVQRGKNLFGIKK